VIYIKKVQKNHPLMLLVCTSMKTFLSKLNQSVSMVI